MSRTLASAIAVALTFACACAPQRAAAQSVAAQARVEPVYGEWRDASRNRVVPYKLYLPESRAAAPVVIFSHGLGGSREAATYLLEHLAANGFAAVAIQHPGTDESLLRGQGGGRSLERLRQSVTDPAGAIARFDDVRFAIDQLERENGAGPYAGRFDLSRLGMSGHSYGALTTLVALGQRVQGTQPSRFRDARIDAGIAYSPNAPRNQDAAQALAGVRTPILYMTGTDDRTPFDLEATPEGRTVPFRTIGGADQYLIVFDGGEHGIYSGRLQARGGMSSAQQAQTEAILRETLIFWRAYLLDDSAALRALCGLPQRVHAIATGEVKAPRCASAH